MIRTNKHNFPQPIVSAITTDEHAAGMGGARISVTGLLKPPRQRVLCEKHDAEIVSDVSDGLEAVLGTAFHALVEKYSTGSLITERLVMTECLGWMVKGSVDSFNPDTGELIDYKTTSVFHVKTLPPEWVQQTNLYAELLRRSGGTVKSICVWAYLKDWRNAEALRDASYPHTKLMRYDIPLWTSEEASAFLEERVKLQQAAEKELPLCTPEETWAQAGAWAVMQPGKKRAVRLFETEEAAKLMVEGTQMYVEERPGKANRCERYCAAKEFCSQYQASLKTNNKGDE